MTRAARHGEWLPAADGFSLAATVVGDGPRVAMLLHGGGQTRHAWDRTALQLAQAGWTAITIDQRGHGESERPADGRYSFGAFGEDALALADAIAARQGRRPVAIGASLGGIASLLALGARSDAFAALILVDITPHMNPEGVDHILGFMAARAEAGFATIEEAADAVGAYLPHRPRPASLEGLKRNLRHDPDGRWRWHWDPRFVDGIQQDQQAYLARAADACAALAVPTLLVRGRQSELVSEEAAAKFRALCPAAEYADIAGARHMVAGDRNDAFAGAILSFLDRRLPA